MSRHRARPRPASPTTVRLAAPEPGVNGNLQAAPAEEPPSVWSGAATQPQDSRRSVLLLTVEDAAAALGIGRTKTYELIANGELEVVHIGRCCRVPTDAVEAYVNALRANRV